MWSRIVAKGPIIATVMIEFGNVLQIAKMLLVWSTLGQAIWGYVLVVLALGMWHEYFRQEHPADRFSRNCMKVGIGMNCLIILTILLLPT